jgi:hypothetical protein
MSEYKKPLVGEKFIDWKGGLLDKTNGRDHWSVDLKNIFGAFWPLFLSIRIVSLLLLYLSSR